MVGNVNLMAPMPDELVVAPKQKIFRSPWNAGVYMSQKQVDIFNCKHRYLLVSGPRRGGKTIGVVWKVLRHMWDTPDAKVVLVTVTSKVGKEGGVWDDLKTAIQEWIGHPSAITGKTFDYLSENKGIPGPRTDPLTRSSTFTIRNCWGGESTLYHWSLDDVAQVEPKFKATRFSMVWFSEFSEFNDPKVFTQVIQSLRLGKRENQQLIGDTNPAKEGDASWIYKTWFSISDETRKLFPHYSNEFKVIEVFLEDNPFISPEEVEELKGSNFHLNQSEYDRNVLGIWVKGGTKVGRFFDVNPANHFIEPSIDIAEDTTELFSGLDAGDKNHAWVALERRVINGLTHWMVLDEVVTLDDKISIEELTWMVMEKMHKLEAFYKRNFTWTHWSDSSALEHWRASAAAFDADVIFNASGGMIQLESVEKLEKATEHGIRIIRRLLRDNRLFIGNNCPKIQQMLMELTEGRTKTVENGPLKHPFDALRYAIYMEERRYNVDLASRPRGVDRSAVFQAG